MRERKLTEQIVVRVTPEQRRWLEAQSDETGRTIAQTLRLYVQREIAAAAVLMGEEE